MLHGVRTTGRAPPWRPSPACGCKRSPASADRDDVLEAKGLIRVRYGKGAEKVDRAPAPRRAGSPALRADAKDRPRVSSVHRGGRFTGNRLSVVISAYLLGHGDPSTTAGYVAFSHVDAAAAVASLRLGSVAPTAWPRHDPAT